MRGGDRSDDTRAKVEARLQKQTQKLEQARFLTQRQRQCVDGIYYVLTHDPYKNSESPGIQAMRKMIADSDYKTHNPEILLNALKKYAAAVNPEKSVKGSLMGMFKGKEGDKGNPEKDFYKKIAKMDASDPYEFEESKVEISNKLILPTGNKAPVPAPDQNYQSDIMTAPRPSKTKSEAAEFQKNSHALMRQLESVREPREYDRVQHLLFETHAVIRDLGIQYLQGAPQRLSSKDPKIAGDLANLRLRLLDMIEDYRATYYPQFKAVGEQPPSPPREFEKVFANVRDILVTRPVDELKDIELVAFQKQCANVMKAHLRANEQERMGAKEEVKSRGPGVRREK